MSALARTHLLAGCSNACCKIRRWQFVAVWRARKDNGNAGLPVGPMRCFLDEEKAKIAARLMRYMPRTGVTHLAQLMLKG